MQKRVEVRIVLNNKQFKMIRKFFKENVKGWQTQLAMAIEDRELVLVTRDSLREV